MDTPRTKSGDSIFIKGLPTNPGEAEVMGIPDVAVARIAVLPDPPWVWTECGLNSHEGQYSIRNLDKT